MKSIKLKLVLAFTALILALTVGLGALCMFTVVGNVTQDAYRDLREMANQEAKYIQARIDWQLSYVSALAQNPILTDKDITLGEKITFFETEAKREGYLALAFADKNGHSTVFNSKRETTNIADREYFKTALNGKATVSDLIVSSVTGDLVLIFAAPVYEHGKIIGVVYGRRDGHDLSEIINEVSYRNTGYAYVINNQGVTVGHKNSALVVAQDNSIENMKTNDSLKQLGELTQKMITRTPGSGEYNYGGVGKLVGFSPIEDTPWIVAFGVTKDDVLSESRELGIKIMVFAVAACAVGIIVTFLISSSIAKVIKRVTAAAQQIAAGEFDVTLSVKSNDEVGQLAQAFNQTLARLKNYQEYVDEISDALHSISNGDLSIELQREYSGLFAKLKVGRDTTLKNLSAIMEQINIASDQVSSGSDQVSAGAQALSQGATEQASSVEELTATILEISEDLRKSTNSAQFARSLSAEAGHEVEASNRQMEKLTTAMAEISKTSHEIGKIIKTIDDIAFQTNILALNAAVEAARAGEAGKGFAVVADEVRNLAAKSAEAAKSTTELIESTLSAIEAGGKLTNETAQSLHQVVSKARTVDEKIEEIASDIERESMAIAQIAAGIDQISAVVQTNSATAEQSAAASEELAGQASLLKEQISKLKLRKGSNQLNYIDLMQSDSFGDKQRHVDFDEIGLSSGQSKY